MNELTLAFSGDIVPARRLASPTDAVRAVYDFVRSADLAIGNFEIALTQATMPLAKISNRRADPSVAADIGVLGFDILTVANNHTVDYGWEGLSDTRRALESGGAVVVGAGLTRDDAMRPVVSEVRGRRIAVLALSCLVPAGAAATESRPGISAIAIDCAYEINPWCQIEEPGDPSAVTIRTRASAADVAHATAAVRRLRATCDCVVVTIHWGFGSGESLAEYQAPLGQALIDAGADVVHGHHPHAIHAVAFHRGRPIFYSPGTFMAQQFFLEASPVVKRMRAGMSRDGYIARVAFEGGNVKNVGLYPTMLDDDYLPRFARGADLERIAERLERLSRPHGTAIVVRDGGALSAAPRD